MAGALGRRVPPDWKHYERYPLTAETAPEAPVPVVIGVNWYSNFDTPVWDGRRWWIGRDPQKLGSIRGGHAVAIEPGDHFAPDGTLLRRLQDTAGWYKFYNQGSEGACVGFSASRMMTLLNRERYNARWLWDWSKMTDVWPDTNPGDSDGTSVRAACNILVSKGHVPWKTHHATQIWQQRINETPVSSKGISVYRWARTADQVFDVLKAPNQTRIGAVRILNSWGASYPQRVWMPAETLQRLIDEDGEVALVTDR